MHRKREVVPIVCWPRYIRLPLLTEPTGCEKEALLDYFDIRRDVSWQHRARALPNHRR